MIPGLEHVSLFNELELESISDIAKFSQRLSLIEGDVFISENEEANSDLFILCEGTVEIVTNGNGITSGEVSLSKQDKEVFGEISWLLNNKRSATIRCTGDVEVIRIDGKKLSQYLEAHPSAGYYVMRHISELLANRLNTTNNLLKQLLWNSNGNI